MRSTLLNEAKGKIYFSEKNESDNSYLRIWTLPELWSTRDPWWDFFAARAIEEKTRCFAKKEFWLEISKWNLTEQGKFPRESHCTTIITIADWQHQFAGNFAQSADHDVTSAISQHFRRVRSWLGREQYWSGNLCVRTRVCHFVIIAKKKK